MQGSKPFVLDGNKTRFNYPQYEPLADKFLTFFIQRNNVIRKLKKIKVLSRNCDVMDKPIKRRLLDKFGFQSKSVNSKVNIKKLSSQNTLRSHKWLKVGPETQSKATGWHKSQRSQLRKFIESMKVKARHRLQLTS